MRTLILGPVNQSSTRERELQAAAARSHAAKVSYVRARTHYTPRKRRYNALDAVTGDLVVWGARAFTDIDLTPATPIYPGFGCFRSELLSLLPPDAQAGDFQALDFFVEVTFPGIDVANEMFDNSGAFHFILPSLTSPVSYHAVMSQLHLTHTMHRQPQVNPNMLMLKHRGKAMEKVRNFLNQPNFYLSEALIFAIVCLSTIEAALGNHQSYKLHLSALKLLGHEKGHLDLPSGLRVADMVALYSDTTFALKTGQSAFKRRQYEETYASTPLPIGIQLPLGFDLLIRQKLITQDTISILVNACRLGVGTPCVALSASQKMFFAGRRQTLKKYLCYLDSVPILLVPDNTQNIFEKMLVLALSLFAWCGFSTLRYPQFAMYNVMMTQLSERLVWFQPVAGIERKCVAWMWLMVIDAWRIGGYDGTLLPQGHDVLWQFRQRFWEYRSWVNVKGLTRLFFWTGDMETFWSRRWDSF